MSKKLRKCKCGKKPSVKFANAFPIPWWVKCECGCIGEVGKSKKKAIKKWNKKKRYNEPKD